MLKLNEDLFDDVVEIDIPNVITNVKENEITLDGPAPGIDAGITDLLLSLINDENSTIQSYNSFKASITGHDDFIPVIEDIIAEEYNHVGMLQKLLNKISPNSETIKQGEEEADNILDNDLIDVDDSFDNGFGGIYV